MILRRRAVASFFDSHYIGCAGLPGTSGDKIPGALSILTGAVPDRARGLGHMAPTYFRREPGIERSNGQRGSALVFHTVIPGRAEGASPESISSAVAINFAPWLWIPALALRARPE